MCLHDYTVLATQTVCHRAGTWHRLRCRRQVLAHNTSANIFAAAHFCMHRNIENISVCMADRPYCPLEQTLCHQKHVYARHHTAHVELTCHCHLLMRVLAYLHGCDVLLWGNALIIEAQPLLNLLLHLLSKRIGGCFAEAVNPAMSR